MSDEVRKILREKLDVNATSSPGALFLECRTCGATWTAVQCADGKVMSKSLLCPRCSVRRTVLKTGVTT